MSVEAFPAIVLAAGGSSRCPEGKLLKEYRSKPLIQWGIETLANSPVVGKVCVVCGHQATEIRKILKDYELDFVDNPNWSRGIASSIRVGTQWLPRESSGFFLCLADTPFFQPETLLKVSPSTKDRDQIRLPVYGGVPGHPKYFPRWLFPELLTLRGDTGAKLLLRQYHTRTCRVEIDDPGILRDFDRPKDFSGEGDLSPS